MLSKKYTFSTSLKVSEIIEKLESITLGKTIKGQKKIGNNFVGDFDESGFSFLRSGDRPFGNYIFTAKFVEHNSNTDIFVSIKPSIGTIAFYFVLIAIMMLILFEGHTNFNLIKIASLAVILLIPFSMLYFALKADIKRAKLFLIDFFQLENQSLLDNKK